MSKAQNSNLSSFALSIRSTNPKAIMLVKAITKDDFDAIQNIIDNTPTKFEKAQIFHSTFMQEKGSKDLTPNENALCELATKYKSTWTITKIKDFAFSAGINVPNNSKENPLKASVANKLSDNSMVKAHNSEPLSIDLINEINQLMGDCAPEAIAA